MAGDDPNSSDRRQHQRPGSAIDAHWSGASANAPCRISDLSWGGCFVQSYAEPAAGERVTVSFRVENQPITLEGTVVYTERPMGFGIQFEPLTTSQARTLAVLLGPPTGNTSSTE